MANGNTKKKIAGDIVNSSHRVIQSVFGGAWKLKRDNLVSALVFIQKAEQILKQK